MRYPDASALSINYGFALTDVDELIKKVVYPADLGLERLNVGLTRSRVRLLSRSADRTSANLVNIFLKFSV